MRQLLRLCFLLVLFVPASAFADLTGTWSGTYNATATACSPPQSTSGAISASLVQSGSNIDGTLVVEIKLVDCQTIFPAVNVGVPISGTVNGNSFMFAMVVNVQGAPLSGGGTGTVSGNTMNVSFTTGDTQGTATLTQTSTAPPDSTLSGTWSGDYNASFKPCGGKLPTVTYSGTLSGSLTQSGTTLSGVITATGLKDDDWTKPDQSDCHVVDLPPETAFLSAQISGGIVFGIVIEENGVEEFVGQISGTTFSGSIIDQGNTGETFTFSMSRTSTTVSPGVVSFIADPSSISSGQASTLSWSTVNATSVSIDHGIGSEPSIGSVSVSPTVTTTYALTASSASGSVTATTTITVSAGPSAGAQVGISSFPRGMVQPAGQAGAIDSFSLTNTGTASTSLTLVPSGGFFTIAPMSFTLAAGATRVVTVTAFQQSGNTFSGSVAVNGNGANGLTVPIRLLSVTPPTARVSATPQIARSDVAAPAGQNPSGSVSFTNTGAAVLRGIAVSDVPWMIPQSGTITIQPGETQAISYTIDSSKRPDASSPLGAVTGKISIVFLAGAAGKTAVLGNASTSTVSVTVVYVVTPGVAAGTPAQLAANELAFFIPGLANKAQAVGDLLIANKQSNGSVSDLKLYFQSSGTSLLASLPQLGSNSAVALPGLLKNVFATSAQSGTAQIRGGDLSKVAVAAIQSNNSSSRGTYATALPVLRSDRGIAAGGQMVLPGASAEEGMQTDLYVQEMTGNPATVQIDFLDENGAVLSSRPPDSLQGFGSLELTNVVPESATAIRIKNNSTGAARIGAYGLVRDAMSGDGWVINDPIADSASNDSTMVVPLAGTPSSPEVLVFATDRSGTASSVTFDVRSGTRHRAVGGHGSGKTANAVFTTNIGAYATYAGKAATTGFMRISSSAGAISVAGRSVTSTSQAGTFGSGLPAIPAGSGIAGNEIRRFAGVEDASPASRAAAAPGTFRTNLILIESSNQPATVKVTLRYTFVAGSAVAAYAVSSKEYSLGPLQEKFISDIARDVIGNARDAFGDLHNMQLDLEVTGGAGRVIPFLQTIDNGSGDTMVRIE